MSDTALNPDWLVSEAYIGFLNQAFQGGWNRASFDWYLAREFAGLKPDLLVRARGKQLLAGVSMAPRQVRVDGGTPLDVGVLSAGGTLPEERGKGHYAELLQAAVQRARERRWQALLGFVTEGNGSGRGLLRLGAHAVRSFYISAPIRAWRESREKGWRTQASVPGPFCKTNAIKWRPDAATALPRLQPRAAFYYREPFDWQQQFVHRPGVVHAYRLTRGSLALIERVGQVDRLQCLQCPDWQVRDHLTALARNSAQSGRRFFTYTLDAQLAASAQRHGLRVRAGYFMLLPVAGQSRDWRTLAAASWHVQSGDRL